MFLCLEKFKKSLVFTLLALLNKSDITTGQSVFEQEAPTVRKDNCSRPPTAQYVEARGIIEVSFETLCTNGTIRAFFEF